VKSLFLLCSAFLPAVVLACSSVPTISTADEGGGSGGVAGSGSTKKGSGAGGIAGSSATAKSTASSTGGSLVIQIDTGAPPDPGDKQIGKEESCDGLALEPQTIEVPQEVTTTIESQVPAPVALYIMLDNSLSMDETGATASKWEEARSALTSFVQDPTSAGLDVAIQYFHPTGGTGQEADECDGVSHATPAVAMGPLPGQAKAIVSSLQSTKTALNTPTTGALTGATNYCATYHATHPDEKCVVILVTDGEPHGCGLSAICSTTTGAGGAGARPGAGGSPECVDPKSASMLTPIAAAGLAKGVVTFTVGMAGVSKDGFALLNQIAIAGGSDCTPGTSGNEACDVSTSGAAGLLAALSAIRDSVTVVETHTETVTKTEIIPLPCEWALPEPPKGQKFDPLLINVNIVDSETTSALYAPSADECEHASGPAWYYDNPEAPTKMYVCPATCDLLTATPTASVQVLLGCKRKDIIL
jgi:hypothetical protein